MVTAFDSNGYYLQLSNPFGGAGSSPAVVDLPFWSIVHLISVSMSNFCWESHHPVAMSHSSGSHSFFVTAVDRVNVTTISMSLPAILSLIFNDGYTTYRLGTSLPFIKA